MQIPCFKHSHTREPISVGSVSGYAPHDCGSTFFAIQTVSTARDIDACDQPLQIPLPWTNHRFVEIIKVENDVTLRSTEKSKVVNVCVAVHRDLNPADRSGR